MKTTAHGDANNCESVRSLLSPHIDGRTAPEEARQVEEHLASCEICRAEIAQLRILVEGLRALPQLPVPRSFTLPNAMARAPRAPLLASILQLRRAAYGLAACLVVLLGANLFVGRAYVGAPSFLAATSPGVERQAVPAAAPAALATPAPGAATDVTAAAASDSPPADAAGQPAAAPLAAAPAPAATPERAAAPKAQAVPPPAAEAAPPAAEATRAAAAPPGLGGPPPSLASGATPAPDQRKAGAAEVAGFAQQPAGQTAQILWAAQLVVAIALLLAAVGAFLGAPGRQS